LAHGGRLTGSPVERLLAFVEASADVQLVVLEKLRLDPN
jgi:hypothetical protein